MTPPEKIWPVSVDIHYLQRQESITIGESAVDLGTLAREQKASYQRGVDGELSYEDVTTYCQSKAITPCLSVAQFNQIARRFTMQDPKAILRALIGHRDWQRFASNRLSVLNLPIPFASMGNPSPFLDTLLELTSATKPQTIARALGMARPTTQQLSRLRYLQQVLPALIGRTLSEHTSHPTPGQKAAIGQLVDTIAAAYGRSTRRAARRYGTFKDAADLAISLNDSALWLKAFTRSGQRKTMHRMLGVPDTDRPDGGHAGHAHRLIVAGAEHATRIAGVLRDITRSTGHTAQWRNFQTKMRPKDLQFLMAWFTKLPVAKQQKHGPEFVQTWKTLTTSQFDPALAPMRAKIDAFNQTLMQHPSGTISLAAMEHLSTSHPEALRVPLATRTTERDLCATAQELAACEQPYDYESEYLFGPDCECPSAPRSLLYGDGLKIQDRIGPLRQTLATMARLDADIQGVLYTLLRADAQTIHRTLTMLQEAAPTLQATLKSEVRGMLKPRIIGLRGTLPITELPREVVNMIAHFVETAQVLGGTFREFGEHYATVEPRLYGKAHYDFRAHYERSGETNPYLRYTGPGLYGSIAGFLGKGDRLVDTIAADEKLLKSKGLTPAQLAEPFHKMRAYVLESGRRRFDVEINGKRFHINAHSNGSQSCPFIDYTDNDTFDLLVTPHGSTKIFFMASVVPHLISHHGFFEGKHAGLSGYGEGTPYRVEPQALIDLLGITSKPLEWRVL
jgi:hypothetical protein